MITIETKHYKHKYYGNIIIRFGDSMINIEAHSVQPQHMNNPDELFIWRSDTYDWFWTEDVISIRGEDSCLQVKSK